jgi:hypothetical protein
MNGKKTWINGTVLRLGVGQLHLRTALRTRASRDILMVPCSIRNEMGIVHSRDYSYNTLAKYVQVGEVSDLQRDTEVVERMYW